MAKYIKTEEGYKLLNEIEGAVSMSGENYIEIKDNIVRTTFGDSIEIIEEEPTKQYADNSIFNMAYNSSFGGYATPTTGIGTPVIPPENGEILEVEIINDSGVSIFNDEIICNAFPSGGARAESQKGLTIIFSREYASLGGTNIIIVYPTNIRGSRIKITGKKQITINGHVTLPKTALNYDEVPTEGSDNLLTSGTIYTALEDVQSNIKSDIENGITTEYIGSSAENIIMTEITKGNININGNSYYKRTVDHFLYSDTVYTVCIDDLEYTGTRQSFDDIFCVGNPALASIVLDNTIMDKYDNGQPFALLNINGWYNGSLIVIISGEIGEGAHTYSISTSESETVYKSMSPYDLIKQIEDLNTTVEALTAKIEALEAAQTLAEEGGTE